MSFAQQVRRRLFAVERPSVQRARLRSLARRLPLVYSILIGTTCTMTVDFDRAPAWLLAVFPCSLVLIGIVRGSVWLRLDVGALDDRSVSRRLRVATLLVIVLAATFTLWCLSLSFFASDEDERVHLAYCTGIVVLGTAFCLVHLRYAATLITVIMVLPTVAKSLASGDLHSMVVGGDLVIVAAVAVLASSGYYRDFRRLNLTLASLAELSDANQRAARIDSLTGIGNRREFFGALDDAVERHRVVGGGFLVGLIDLDGFKPINDLHGHAAGDALLVAVAMRLRDALPADAICGRLGGDEFAFLAPAVHEAEAAERLALTLCAAIAAPLLLPSAQVRVSASIGLAIHPSMGTTREQLVEHADFALYHAKAKTRGSPVLFCADHADKIGAERRLKHALRWANLNEEMSLVFQPIVDVVANRVTSFEALARWNSPILGQVSPVRFIPVAERIGMIGAITETIFSKACAIAKLWPDSIDLSFNLSSEDLAGLEAATRLRRLIATTGIAPRRLIFEVTETAVIQDFDGACACLEALQSLGCRIALDDFGTGFSSLSYVHRLPLDKLKIDGSFVRSLAADPASRSIVQTIIDLSVKLDLGCVVEGVELQEQADTLRAMGCVTMQGWLFGMPISESTMTRGDFPLAAFTRTPIDPSARTEPDARHSG